MTNGRPRSVDKAGKQRGDKTLTLRVTNSQLNRLKDIANNEGLTVSELVRRRILG